MSRASAWDGLRFFQLALSRMASLSVCARLDCTAQSPCVFLRSRTSERERSEGVIVVLLREVKELGRFLKAQYSLSARCLCRAERVCASASWIEDGGVLVDEHTEEVS